MQLAWLEDFVELARTRSFARAAELRCVTHPAFGRRIRALELWVGAALVERKQPAALTPAGVLFLEAATYTLNVLHSARGQLQERSSLSETPLRIATGRTLSRTYFPEWYQGICHRFGALPVSVVTSGSQEAIAKLAAGDVDLLITYSSPVTRLLIDARRYESQLLATELMLPVSAPDARGAARYQLSYSSTSPTPWLAFSSSLTLRGILAKHMAELPRKIALHMVYQCDSYDSILEMAIRGIGLAWLPERLVREEIQRGRLLVVGDSSVRVRFDIALYRRRDSTANHWARTIWEGLTEAVPTPAAALAAAVPS
jgi:DNA-binding transcriptional LysR family regulator